jgi:hypothetical protein
LQREHCDAALLHDVHQEEEQNGEPLDAEHHHARTKQRYVTHRQHQHLYCATQRREMPLHHCAAMQPSLLRADFRRDYLYCVHQRDVLEVRD